MSGEKNSRGMGRGAFSRIQRGNYRGFGRSSGIKLDQSQGRAYSGTPSGTFREQGGEPSQGGKKFKLADSSHETVSLPGKIFLRWDQKEHLIGNSRYQNNKIMIYAPEWIKEALGHLATKIPKGSQFIVHNGNGPYKYTGAPTKHKLTIEDEISLVQFVSLARNEPTNKTGEINFESFSPVIQDKTVIYSMRDLVRQCVIVGADRTTHYGGYPRGSSKIPQDAKVYIADLAGLQFQKNYNSGRLVLIEKDGPVGFLDDFIFKSVVGEEKCSFASATADKTGRYLKISRGFFDSFAYKKFVSDDFVLTGLALNEISENEPINFKFLKYGAGFFAGTQEIRKIVASLINEGILDGIQRLLAFKSKWITSIELPFFDFDQRIEQLCKGHGIPCVFSNYDALKTTRPNCLTGTTNCADPHVVLGNQVRHTSVDGAIGNNLISKGHPFSPNINKLMGGKFISLSSS